MGKHEVHCCLSKFVQHNAASISAGFITVCMKQSSVLAVRILVEIFEGGIRKYSLTALEGGMGGGSSRENACAIFASFFVHICPCRKTKKGIAWIPFFRKTSHLPSSLGGENFKHFY